MDEVPAQRFNFPRKAVSGAFLMRSPKVHQILFPSEKCTQSNKTETPMLK